MKVALFGGTFDPVHNGHVNAALEVIRLGLAQQVWFVPVYWHRFKSSQKVSSVSHRLKIIELAIEGQESLKVVDLNENPTTTLETIRKAKKRFPGNEFFWLMGSNLVEEFDSWVDAKEIPSAAKLLIFPVPGSEEQKSPSLDESNSIRVETKKEIDLSSTIVRDKLSNGEDVSSLVNSAVLSYIKENNLYK